MVRDNRWEHTQVLPYNPFFEKSCITYFSTTILVTLSQTFGCVSPILHDVITLKEEKRT